MKTLYISDLDGTLLNSEAELSPFTVKTLNELMKDGMHFSIATARSAASIIKILEPLSLTIPVILMNGAILFDTSTATYLDIHYMPTAGVTELLSIIKALGITGFLYEIKDNTLSTYYEELSNACLRNFCEERVTKYGKTFFKTSDFTSLGPDNIVYFTFLDKKELLTEAKEAIDKIPGLTTAFYRDVYDREDNWFLEIFSDKATKYNAVQYIREHFQYDKVVGFGDNLNDIPLFRACDLTCAVDNAKTELKEMAHHIIDSNVFDGVANWLKKNYNH